jgi:hypothetical protein
MATSSKRTIVRMAVVAACLFAYFVAFPQDLSAALGPLQAVLTLSNAVSPWLYGLIAVAILASTAVRIWGSREHRSAEAVAVPPH